VPIEDLIANIENPNHNSFKELLSLEDGKVVTKNNSKADYKQAGTPDYSDLLLDKYISVIEIVNPCTACGATDAGINSPWRMDAIGEMYFCDISLIILKLLPSC
jgi:hypothetical protein